MPMLAMPMLAMTILVHVWMLYLVIGPSTITLSSTYRTALQPSLVVHTRPVSWLASL